MDVEYLAAEFFFASESYDTQLMLCGPPFGLICFICTVHPYEGLEAPYGMAHTNSPCLPCMWISNQPVLQH